MGQPFYCSYVLRWHFNEPLDKGHFDPQPFAKSDLLSLDFPFGKRAPQRNIPYGFSRIVIAGPKDLPIKLHLRGGVHNRFLIEATICETFSVDVRPGALSLFFDKDVGFIASFPEGMETRIVLGGISNRTGQPLSVRNLDGEEETMIGKGKTTAIMSGEWHVRYRGTDRKIVVEPLKILVIK